MMMILMMTTIITNKKQEVYFSITFFEMIFFMKNTIFNKFYNNLGYLLYRLNTRLKKRDIVKKSIGDD